MIPKADIVREVEAILAAAKRREEKRQQMVDRRILVWRELTKETRA